MTPLELLVRDASGPAQGMPGAGAAEAEVARQMQICNACRYCEGFCAVFPAMTRRLQFPAADVHYLANLCHNCGACLHACQYAPPHEFALNVPQAMARVRRRTYAAYAWPARFGRLYEHNGLALALALAASWALCLVLAVLAGGGPQALWDAPVAGDFYAIFPHRLMVGLFAPVFVFALLALGVGVVRFWREAPPGAFSAPAVAEAAHDALRLKYLDGGHGDGCHERDDAHTLWRRRWHHAVFYGFVLCFAATCVATAYHYGFGWIAPYRWSSVPKLLGTIGGVMLVAGSVGLFVLQRRRHPLHRAPEQSAMDLGFIALLGLTGATGLALALARASGAMPLLLCAHLGAVLALFATLPYGKFAHAAYRAAALLKWAIERRTPAGLQLAAD
jgi:citrate/tricarballylate utilization protein